MQSDAALFNRLCPAGKGGKRAFAPVMLRRLKKLGIAKTDPAELTAEEQGRCGGCPACLQDIPPTTEACDRTGMTGTRRRHHPLSA